MADFLKIALNEARQGRKVFPCRGKLPAIPKTEGGSGVLDATSDEGTILEWAKKYPSANVGIGFFADSAEVGLDLDSDNLQAWLEANHPPVATRKVKTGRGGFHFYFLRPDGVSIPNVPKSKGFEIMSKNKYLMAPGSIHPDTGKPYVLVDDSPTAPMPDWLVRRCLNSEKSYKTVSRPITELRDGQRHADLISFIGKWRARGFTEPEIIAQALALNHDSATPLPDDEVLQMVREYENQTKVKPDGKPKPFDWHDHAITHSDLLNKQLQPISFLVDDILIDTGTGVLAGRKKLGKSFLATQLSQSVAGGTDFLEHKVKQGSVVHFALEDGDRRTQSRLRMQQARHDLPITYFYKWPAWNTPAGFNQLRTMLSELKPALVVVDTFAKILNGKPEQNSASDMGDFGNRMHDLALELDLMILFFSHHGKGLQLTTRDPGFDIRGSSAIPGATDINVGLYKNEDRTFELVGEGRDIPEFDFRVSFDKETTWAWQLEGEAQDLRRKEAEAKILEALELLGEADASSIAKQTDTSRVAVNGHLKRMRDYDNSPITYRTMGNKIIYILTNITDLTNK